MAHLSINCGTPLFSVIFSGVTHSNAQFRLLPWLRRGSYWVKNRMVGPSVPAEAAACTLSCYELIVPSYYMQHCLVWATSLQPTVQRWLFSAGNRCLLISLIAFSSYSHFNALWFVHNWPVSCDWRFSDVSLGRPTLAHSDLWLVLGCSGLLVIILNWMVCEFFIFSRYFSSFHTRTECSRVFVVFLVSVVHLSTARRAALVVLSRGSMSPTVVGYGQPI